MNKKIIEPVAQELIEAELTPDSFLRRTNKGGNTIYIVDAHSAPNVMREIGRLREIAFRSAGGGTGNDCDIDEFDTMDPPCRQLIVWDPDSKLILGGYRFICGRDIRYDEHGRLRIATAHMFNFSRQFIENYLPYTIELGRSWVRPEYQSSRAGAKALYALDNLWDGLGSLTVINPEIRYLFGKVTMYPNYTAVCRDLILYFLHKHFPDPEQLVRPIKPVEYFTPEEQLASIFTGSNFKEDYMILNSCVRSHGDHIPPLVNAYMSLSPTMRMFGTAVNTEFGNVEESGIFFAVDEILDTKKRRHIDTYKPSDHSPC